MQPSTLAEDQADSNGTSSLADKSTDVGEGPYLPGHGPCWNECRWILGGLQKHTCYDRVKYLIHTQGMDGHRALDKVNTECLTACHCTAAEVGIITLVVQDYDYYYSSLVDVEAAAESNSSLVDV